MENVEKKGPEIVTYAIPKFEIYQVTEDELKRIEEGCDKIGQDLTFSISSISIAATFIISLMAGSFNTLYFIIFAIVSFILVVIFLYTGIRWWTSRKKTPDVISNIRKRKDNPDVHSAESEHQ